MIDPFWIVLYLIIVVGLAAIGAIHLYAIMKYGGGLSGAGIPCVPPPPPRRQKKEAA